MWRNLAVIPEGRGKCKQKECIMSSGIIIGVIIGAIVLFLVCRELICWYYKINRILALMEEQNSLLKFLLKNNTQTPSSSGTNISNVPPIHSVVNTGDSWVCKKCSERNPNTASSCKGCGAYK
jgi:hypothetical protein